MRSMIVCLNACRHVLQKDLRISVSHLISASIFLLASYTLAPSIWAEDRSDRAIAVPVFSSAYTDLAKECKPATSEPNADGQDTPLSCPPFKGYMPSIGFSANGACLGISRIGPPADKYEPEIPTITCESNDIAKRKLEWRLVDGQPFAVIFRQSEWTRRVRSPDDMRPDYWDVGHQKIGESLLIKGLTGFGSIDDKVDTKKNANANELARQKADDGYRRIQRHNKN